MEIGDVIAIVISVVSILFSIYSFFKNNELSRKINSVNLESELYMDIFKDFLLEKIPRTRNKIYIDSNGKVCGYDELINVVIDLKKKSVYFSYRKHTFYKNLREKLSEIEDNLVETEGRTYLGRDSVSFLTEIDRLLESLYCFILDSYFGNSA